MKSKSDYLKYWRVVRYYIKTKYKLSESDLEMLLFLYSEKYFGRYRFIEFQKLLPWDNVRFYKLMKSGWIEMFRQKRVGHMAIYQLSHKANKMIETIYKILDGEDIEVRYIDTTVFKREVAYTDKLYKDMIEKIRKATREKILNPNKELL
jgi:hypothetical protein